MLQSKLNSALINEINLLLGENALSPLQAHLAMDSAVNSLPEDIFEMMRDCPAKIIPINLGYIDADARNKIQTFGHCATVGDEHYVFVYFVAHNHYHWEELSGVLSHELIHHKQMADGRLKFIDRDRGIVEWDGKRYCNLNVSEVFTGPAEDMLFKMLAYYAQPWELEAQRGKWHLEGMGEMEEVIKQVGTCWDNSWNVERFKSDFREGGIRAAYAPYGYDWTKNIRRVVIDSATYRRFIEYPVSIMKLSRFDKHFEEVDAGVFKMKAFDSAIPRDAELVARINTLDMKGLTINEMIAKLVDYLKTEPGDMAFGGRMMLAQISDIYTVYPD